MAILKKRNILLKLEYRGSGFSGWQIQAGGRTVQGVLSEKLGMFLKEEIKPTGSGRTDTGVHALSQYANFHTCSGIDTGQILYKLNRMLPDDIVVHGCREVSPEFNARKHATARTYRYQICEKRSAIHSEYSWVIAKKLDMDLLSELARIVAKSSHFHNFCKVKSRKEDNTCRISKSLWTRSAGFLKYEITADRFLHNMVRLLVGSMIAVCRGDMTAGDFKRKLEKNIDDKSKHIAPPQGLYLADVKYEGITL